MSDQPLVQYASRTDVGMRRSANQDSLAVRLCNDSTEWEQCGHLFVVADGMGGHSVGDLASRITVETLPLAYFKVEANNIPERLLSGVKAANRAINDKARENPEFADMGTTCSSLVLTPYGAYIGHVGDSRVYRVRNGKIQQLSFDHSLQWEMIRQGRATMDNVDMLHPRNVITRCLGPDPDVNIDIEGPFHVQAGDRFVICSDGLTGHVSDTEIGAVATNLPAGDASKLLINLANCRGGADNITVVIASVESFPVLSGSFEDEAAGQTAPEMSIKAKGKSLFGKISLVIFAFLATIGLALLAQGNNAWGLLFICPAVILGFIRLIISTSSQPAPENPDQESARTHQMPPGDRPAASSPYRTSSAKIERSFMDFLAEAQSELTQAGKENGWKIDFEEIADLNRRAIESIEHKKSGQAMQCRADAIDQLMRQLYAQTRRS